MKEFSLQSLKQPESYTNIQRRFQNWCRKLKVYIAVVEHLKNFRKTHV